MEIGEHILIVGGTNDGNIIAFEKGKMPRPVVKLYTMPKCNPLRDRDLHNTGEALRQMPIGSETYHLNTIEVGKDRGKGRENYYVYLQCQPQYLENSNINLDMLIARLHNFYNKTAGKVIFLP